MSLTPSRIKGEEILPMKNAPPCTGLLFSQVQYKHYCKIMTHSLKPVYNIQRRRGGGVEEEVERKSIEFEKEKATVASAEKFIAC